jgi:hypothetical protein
MKIWIVLKADEVDYSSAFGYSKVLKYFFSEEEAIAEIDRIAPPPAGKMYYHYETLEIDLSDFMPQAL